MITLGKNLRVGDTIEIWWRPGRDTITRLTPYTGPLRNLWDCHGGARLAEFALSKTGMTIDPQSEFNVLTHEEKGEQ
jgi:hypothetical protein